ncbi:MAG TPA: hypothetical protein VK752_27640 [Bryobacteraceae bacterium]|jgi:hypothetical protein|nr:hypothetical protein [Bryobacteraceae bacterium]
MKNRRVVFFLGFCAACVVILFAMRALTNYINGLPFTFTAWDPEAAAGLSKAFDAYSAVTNLFTTLGTGLLTAMGLFLTSNRKQRYDGGPLWLAFASALCVCVSIYWGYISSQNVEWAIEGGYPSLDIPKLQWPKRMQGCSILAGVFFFAIFLILDFTKEDSHERPAHVDKA